jgi:hypothetical protein
MSGSIICVIDEHCAEIRQKLLTWLAVFGKLPRCLREEDANIANICMWRYVCCWSVLTHAGSAF